MNFLYFLGRFHVLVLHLPIGIICALFVVRSFVEIDIIFPFQIGSFLLYFAAGKLCLPAKATQNSETHPAIGVRLQTRA